MKHLKENNETYFTHLRFAGGMGLHLLVRGMVFILHGLIPFEIPKRLDLSNTAEMVNKWNNYAKNRHNTER
tara:strand:+ start:537 stop:749 length:213 start_codon:yes stop_codon:yes gene_type:complete